MPTKPKAPARYPGRRITVGDVRRAYRKTGLQPSTGSWGAYSQANQYGRCEPWDGKTKLDGRGCALFALGVAESITERLYRRGEPLDRLWFYVASYLGLHKLYVDGFVYGFDGLDADGTAVAYLTGWRDGRRVRAKIIQEPTTASVAI